jgi:hypothetical protein
MGISSDKGPMDIMSKGLDERKHLRGSINLGNNQMEYTSEAKSK